MASNTPGGMAGANRVAGTDTPLKFADDEGKDYEVTPTGDTVHITKQGNVHGGMKRRVVAKTAAYTCTEEDNGTLFTTRGAVASVTFTLPAVLNNSGLWYEFYVAADDEMIVAAPDEDLMAFNDLTADSFSVTQAGEHIGTSVKVVCDGESWLLILSLAAEAVTTVVTSA